MNFNLTRRMLKQSSVKIPIFTNLPQHNKQPKTKGESKLFQPIDGNNSYCIDDENVEYFEETQEQSPLSEQSGIDPEIVQIQDNVSTNTNVKCNDIQEVNESRFLF